MYKIVLNDDIGKRLIKFPASEHKKIHKVLLDLEKDPLPKNRDIKKLQGTGYAIWRIRAGNLRIIYTYASDSLVVKILKIDFRGNVYD